MSLRHFCTYFDKNYLSRGLTLYESLRAHHPELRLYVCCFDDETYAYLSRRELPSLVPVRLADLEAFDPELRATQSTRARVEYLFTATASWLRYVLHRFADVDLLTYVDADFRFYASSEPLFAEMGDASIAIVEHGFAPELRHLEIYGRFNVGWLSFRRDEQGSACIGWWRERCIEWCYDRLEGDRFADQKYLDRWPELFSSLVVLRHKGVNVAPWNLKARGLRLDGARLCVDGDALICFHFHGLKHVLGPLYDSGLREYHVKLDSGLRRALFEPYLLKLMHHESELRRAGLTSGHATNRRYAKTGLMRTTEILTGVRLLLSRTYLLTPRIGPAP
jgi:hypothetical protein